MAIHPKVLGLTVYQNSTYNTHNQNILVHTHTSTNNKNTHCNMMG